MCFNFLHILTDFPIYIIRLWNPGLRPQWPKSFFLLAKAFPFCSDILLPDVELGFMLIPTWTWDWNSCYFRNNTIGSSHRLNVLVQFIRYLFFIAGFFTRFYSHHVLEYAPCLPIWIHIYYGCRVCCMSSSETTIKRKRRWYSQIQPTAF